MKFRRKLCAVLFVLSFGVCTSAMANPISKIGSATKGAVVTTAHVVKRVVEVPVHGGESVVGHVRSAF